MWCNGISLNPNFILECLKYFENKNLLKNNVNLWIFSDNIDKAKNILSTLNINYNIKFIEKSKYDYEDLWFMSLIEYHILSFSSFSWWGAYLNNNENKKILYSNDYYDTFFKKILRKNDTYDRVINNYYPSDWICINQSYMII